MLRVLISFIFFILLSSLAYGAQPNLDVPEGVTTKVTLNPGRVETNPLNVGIRKGLVIFKIGRSQVVNPQTGVTVQLWSLISGNWTQMCQGAKSVGRELLETVTISCRMRGGTQTKAIIFTSYASFTATLLIEIQ